MTATGERLPIASSSQTNVQPSWLSQVWHSLMRAIMVRSEPYVKPIVTRSGQIWWYLYDPMSGQSTYCASEAEARVWLEQRFSSYSSRVAPER